MNQSHAFGWHHPSSKGLLMALCPRTLASDYMCWRFAGGKAFAFVMWKRKDTWTHGTWMWLLLIPFQCVDLKLVTKESPCFCYVPSKASGISGFPENIFHFLMQGEQKWEGEENTWKRSLIKPRKFWGICIDSDGLNSGPELNWKDLARQPWIFLR